MDRTYNIGNNYGKFNGGSTRSALAITESRAYFRETDMPLDSSIDRNDVPRNL